MKKQNVLLPVVLAGGAGALAFVVARRASASDKPGGVTPDKPDGVTPDKPGGVTPDKPDGVTPDKPDGVTPDKPKPKRVIGSPYKPGVANAAHNAKQACVDRARAEHPNGYRKGTTQSLEDWLTNVAYWETTGAEPSAPERITDTKKQATWAKLWLRIRALVRKCLKPIAPDKPDKPDVTPDKPDATTPDANKPGTATKMPDRAAEIRNAALAVQQNPQTFPRNPPPYNKRQPNQANVDWLTNAAYWETYRDGPLKLSPKDAKHKPYIDAWRRINGLVSVNLAKKQQKKNDVPKPDVPGPSADPKKPATDTKPSADQTPPPKLSTSKDSIASAAEVRNAAIVAVDQPTTYGKREAPYDRWKGSNDKQKIEDWLANVAFWETYPNAPTRLDPKDASHKGYVAAWMRIRDHVGRAFVLQKKLQQDAPGGGVRSRDWKVWGAVMVNASGLRTPDAITNGWVTARKFFATPTGGALAKRFIGVAAGPLTVTLSGLLAEAAQRAGSGKSMGNDWTQDASRAFWAATTLF